MTIHHQVWVKVNAQVDEGVAALIEALNAFSGVRTIESCEGSEASAWVCFDRGETQWAELSDFVFALIGPPLMAKFGDRITLSVGITDSGLYRADMTVVKSIIPAVSEALRQLPDRRMAA